MTKKERYQLFIEHFLARIPNATTELNHESAYELIVATILSAQCTDKRVNLTTPALYSKFPDFQALSQATFDDLQPIIKSISYPNNKARHLIAMAQKVMEDFDGKLPDDVDTLQQLPGVGRKTANVLASVLYQQPAMAVDTHVFRVSARIGLTTNAKNPYQAEMQLIKNIPNQYIPMAHHWLILHGRYVCQARKPKCEGCEISNLCKYYTQIKKGI